MSRVFVLGAGFSKAAGLPLATELFNEVLGLAKRSTLYKNILYPDLELFIEYKSVNSGRNWHEDEINYEEFISFLDFEHFLGLTGSDTWTGEGNRSQMVIKNLIAQILHDRQSKCTKDQLKLYLSFVKKLNPQDVIITFNYDTILEACLDKIGKPYRLFPTRYADDGPGGRIVNTDASEVIILKMHGSIDWFNVSGYLETSNYLRMFQYFATPKHPIFSNSQRYRPTKIIDTEHMPDSPLDKIYKVQNLEEYFYEIDKVSQAPLILAPSYNKILYASPLKDFWYGFNNEGSFNTTVSIIGFSLPNHDEYVRQALYALVRNFQNFDPGIPEVRKTNLKMIDFRKSKEEIDEYQKTYSFVNWSKTDCYFKGFNEEALKIIFNE